MRGATLGVVVRVRARVKIRVRTILKDLHDPTAIFKVFVNRIGYDDTYWGCRVRHRGVGRPTVRC